MLRVIRLLGGAIWTSLAVNVIWILLLIYIARPRSVFAHHNIVFPDTTMKSAQMIWPVLTESPFMGRLDSWTRVMASWCLFILIGTTALCKLYGFHRKGNAALDIPHVGLTDKSSWISRLGFFASAQKTIEQGYRKYHDQPFKICGNDVVVLPQRYVNELRVLPEQKIGAMEANLANMQSAFAHLDILGKTDLFVKVISTRLTPKLGLMATSIRRELDFAMNQELPCAVKSVDGTVVEVFGVFHRIVGRLSARITVGPELCRNPQWLDAAEGYSSNMFKVTIAMRLLPKWARHPMSYFVPHSWRVSRNFHKALRILIPYIEQRRKADPIRPGQTPDETGDFGDLLQSLTMEARGSDAKSENLASMVLALTLASNHTTSMALTEAIFDLCEHSQYVPELREEIEEALVREGGWSKRTLTHLRKLDSFIKESQRLHPPSLMGYKRRIRQDIVLSDGLRLPANSHVEFAIVDIQRSDTHIPDVFDGLRYYRMRQSPERINSYQFASTSPTSLHFGHGQHSCPGRFTASIEIKMILASLLMEYDIKYENENAGRPQGIHAFEYIFPSPTARVLIRARQTDTRIPSRRDLAPSI